MADVTSGRDPMAWQEALERALEAPALADFDRAGQISDDAKAAAYQVAVALGYCRLCDVSLPSDLDGVLSAPEAIAAGEELLRCLKAWQEEARQLPKRWDTEPPGTEIDLCAEVLEARMDAWAVYVAISETHEDLLIDKEPGSEELESLIGQIEGELDELDSILTSPEIFALLSTLAETPILNNWRRMLRTDDPDCLYLPWWLDGCLEEKDRQITAELGEFEQNLLGFGPRLRAGELSQPGVPRHSAAPILAIKTPAPLAAEGGEEEPPIPVVLRWSSPDGQWQARLACPRDWPDDSPLVVEFFDTRYDPATALAGQPVWLAGQEANIDDQGRAHFPLENLKARLQACDVLTLEVGQERIEWAATE
ncbi:MAG TPA: hypothetical protein PLO20_15300 [Thermogutta sp.]|nr:hypothetical protein [Thermogutta sp.]